MQPKHKTVPATDGSGNGLDDDGTLAVYHPHGRTGPGFFSCCTVRLVAILNYVKTRRCKPLRIDGRHLFDEYKPPGVRDLDVSGFFFADRDVEIPSNVVTTIATKAWRSNYRRLDHESHRTIPEDGWAWRSNYRRLDHEVLAPFLERYFTPSRAVDRLVRALEEKYGLTDYGNLCAVYYRGTDKGEETEPPPYHEILGKARKIARMRPELRFLVQSDEADFLDAAATFLPNTVIFTDENLPRGTDQGFQHALWLLAIVVIMAKCRYLVCTSSNVSFWIVLYRGTTRGVAQYFKRTGRRSTTRRILRHLSGGYWLYGKASGNVQYTVEFLLRRFIHGYHSLGRKKPP